MDEQVNAITGLGIPEPTQGHRDSLGASATLQASCMTASPATFRGHQPALDGGPRVKATAPRPAYTPWPPGGPTEVLGAVREGRESCTAACATYGSVCNIECLPGCEDETRVPPDRFKEVTALAKVPEIA